MARFWELDPPRNALVSDEFSIPAAEKPADLDYLGEKHERHWMAGQMRNWANENMSLGPEAKRILKNAADKLDWGPTDANRGTPPYGF